MPRPSVPISSSWRLVEGENDSFDTSIVDNRYNDDDFLDDEFISSSPLASQPTNPSSSFNPTQSSFDASVGGSSQGSLQDFLSRADDEQVILRTPFRPTVPANVRQQQQQQQRTPQHRQGSFRPQGEALRSPDPEFVMPMVDVDSPRRNSRASSTRTIRPMQTVDEAQVLRRRFKQEDSAGSPQKPLRPRIPQYEPPSEPGLGHRFTSSVPHVLFETGAWFLGVVGMAFSYAKRPLALLLAIYLFCGGVIIVQNMVTHSVYSSLSPVCRIPGAKLLDLPFCAPDIGPAGLRNSPVGEHSEDSVDSDSANKAGAGTGAGDAGPVEFDDLMLVQSSFEEVLEESAAGVSLPLEMKRSEASIRDLRTLVRYSSLPAREELVLEFDGFIDSARESASGLQAFNTHVGSAVDSVIAINRFTMRYIDSLAPGSCASSSPNLYPELGGYSANTECKPEDDTSLVVSFFAWLFSPFQPQAFSEAKLRQKYIEHTSLVSDKIASLLLEAQAVLMHLSRAEGHLGVIYEVVARETGAAAQKKDDLLWTLWGLVGGNAGRVQRLEEQLGLLRKVDAQRSQAVARVMRSVMELEEMQEKLEDLRDRVAGPGIVAGDGEEGKEDGRTRNRLADVPLEVHIETINRGVERLEEARRRIRAEENERVREVLARGRDEERLIDQV